MSQRTKLVIAYLGGPFHGWQRQLGQRTVQGEIELALRTMTKGLKTAVVGAGRTDAGVHAAGQVAHLDLPGTLPVCVLARSLNRLLPTEIRVLSAVAVGPHFHARFSARAKHYLYRGRWREPRLPWHGLRSARVPPIQDHQAFAAALQQLTGEHDFASFSPPAEAGRTTRRTLYRAWAKSARTGINLHFLGDGFLRYQVRRMVGALLQVGQGTLDTGVFRQLIEEPLPGTARWTAPARGLTLEKVYYRTPAALRGQVL